jgi:hypothetical protein
MLNACLPTGRELVCNCFPVFLAFFNKQTISISQQEQKQAEAVELITAVAARILIIAFYIHDDICRDMAGKGKIPANYCICVMLNIHLPEINSGALRKVQGAEPGWYGG